MGQKEGVGFSAAHLKLKLNKILIKVFKKKKKTGFFFLVVASSGITFLDPVSNW